jgi:glycosyltransferase involved in cell wall biosynthesis
MRVCQLRGPSTGGIRRHVEALSGALSVMGVQSDGVVVQRLADITPRTLSKINRADVIHAHGLKVGLLASIVGRRPLVVTVHNVSFAGQSLWRRRTTQLIEKIVGRRADAIIATSAAIVDELRGFGVAGDKISLFRPFGPVPNPRTDAAAVRASFGLSADDLVVATVARLHEQKALDVLIDAFAQIVAAEPRARLVIVGSGPLRDELRNQVGLLGLRDRVIMRDDADDVAGVVAMADVFVITSVWESGPLVALEAAELSRPIVATSVGFVAEVFVDGQSCVVVPVRDATATAKEVLELLADPQLARAIGEAGNAAVNRWLDRGALVAAHRRLYDDVI